MRALNKSARRKHVALIETGAELIQLMVESRCVTGICRADNLARDPLVERIYEPAA